MEEKIKELLEQHSVAHHHRPYLLEALTILIASQRSQGYGEGYAKAKTEGNGYLFGFESELMALAEEIKKDFMDVSVEGHYSYYDEWACDHVDRSVERFLKRTS